MNLTLLLRLDGPMQSWSAQDRGEAPFILLPMRSELISMVATALAYRRDESLDGLEFFDAAVRADEPGRLLSDFQTSWRTRTPTMAAAETQGGQVRVNVQRRHYATDAVFTAALAGSAETIEAASAALRRPGRQVFLGRRCCPPAAPIVFGVSELPALEALRAVPYQGHRERPPGRYQAALYSSASAQSHDGPPRAGGAPADERHWTCTDIVIAAQPPTAPVFIRPRSEALP